MVFSEFATDMLSIILYTHQYFCKFSFKFKPHIYYSHDMFSNIHSMIVLHQTIINHHFCDSIDYIVDITHIYGA